MSATPIRTDTPAIPAAGGPAPGAGASAVDALDDAREALARGAWEEARERYERALAAAPSAEAWEGLALAASYLDDAGTSLDARERAFRLWREAGDPRGAARCAVWLANDVMEFHGDLAVANGWLQRARSLLAEVAEPTPERAMLLGFLAHLALQADNDTAAARRLCAEASAVCRQCGFTDVEMLVRALDGLALVSEGHVADGMRRLDEATAAAVAGEMTDPTLIATSCCYMFHACERVRDYPRALQWSERVRALAERWRMGSFFVVCRTQYATILMCRGEFAAAEELLQAAIGHAETHRRALARSALVRLAELRRRQGRLDEAESLFARMGAHRLAALGRALIAVERGDAAEGEDLLDGLLGRIPTENRTERAAGLEALVAARLSLGKLEEAGRAADELAATAAAVGTEPLRAAACAARGALLAAAGRHGEARHLLEDAVARYEASGEAYELARTQVALARTLAALGRGTAARTTASAAADALVGMGALGEARRAREVARAAVGAGAGRRRPAGAPRPLSPRELDVLRLVAGGAGDRAIAERLALSEHTVHRHVANILRKLNVTSRAAAAAHAVRRHLV